LARKPSTAVEPLAVSTLPLMTPLARHVAPRISSPYSFSHRTNFQSSYCAVSVALPLGVTVR
jgi:hypothetical protein